jgi:hypothetical protein
MNIKIIRLSSLLFAFVLTASVFCFDFTAEAGTPNTQNANSSMTSAQNSNTGRSSRGRGRRHRRGAKKSTTETTATPPESTTMPTAATEQTDLSGTYTGTFDCPDVGVNGETTLTITGNQFTLTDGKTGRIVASTTRGYTAVAMQFGESKAPSGTEPGSMPTIISMRARKSGDRLTLTPVAGLTRVCTFTPPGASRGTGTRHRRIRTATPAKAAEPATPAEPAMTPATPAEAATPASPTPTPPIRRD